MDKVVKFVEERGLLFIIILAGIGVLFSLVSLVAVTVIDGIIWPLLIFDFGIIVFCGIIIYYGVYIPIKSNLKMPKKSLKGYL